MLEVTGGDFWKPYGAPTAPSSPARSIPAGMDPNAYRIHCGAAILLRSWIRQQRINDGKRDGVSSEAAAEIRALKRRIAELEQTIVISGSRAACR